MTLCTGFNVIDGSTDSIYTESLWEDFLGVKFIATSNRGFAAEIFGISIFVSLYIRTKYNAVLKYNSAQFFIFGARNLFPESFEIFELLQSHLSDGIVHFIYSSNKSPLCTTEF